MIHVRDYRRGYNNFHIPEAKGIALTLDVWRTMYELIDYINEDVEELAEQC